MDHKLQNKSLFWKKNFKVLFNNDNMNKVTTSVCFTSVFSPNIVVIVAAVLSSGQKGGCSTFKALHGQCALTRSHIDFGKVHGTKLNPPNEVSGSILCTETQTQARYSADSSSALLWKRTASKGRLGRRLMLHWPKTYNAIRLLRIETKGLTSVSLWWQTL